MFHGSVVNAGQSVLGVRFASELKRLSCAAVEDNISPDQRASVREGHVESIVCHLVVLELRAAYRRLAPEIELRTALARVRCIMPIHVYS